MRTLVALTLAVGVSACAPAPKPQVTPVAPPPVPVPTFEQKQSWILQLEDRRILRDLEMEVPPFPPPDLLRFLTDDEARVRRRAALAVGRVGLREGVTPLVSMLADTEPEVRQMAAFGLGLIKDRQAVEPLVGALGDESSAVKGSAAEALGLIGDASAADAIGRMASQIVQSGGLTDVASAEVPRDAPAGAVRLALYALVRLKAFAALASAVLDGDGQPRMNWWPVAFALQRLEDARGLPALLTLAKSTDPYTRAFAVKGLGALKDRSAVPAILPLVSGPDRESAIEAIRALGRIGDPAAAPVLIKLIQAEKPDPSLRLEAVAVLGFVGGEGVLDALLDLLTDPNPALRAAVIRSLAQVDPQMFVTILSGLEPDRHPSVRAALASALGTLSPEAGLPRLRTMIQDSDQRVVTPVLASLTKLRAPEAATLLLDRLKADDPVVRATAATALGELKPEGGVAALTEAYQRGLADATYVARAAAIAALATYGPSDAIPVLTEALKDKDWALRLRAGALLKEFEPESDIELRIRPAPTMHAPDIYRADRLVNPRVSPQAFIDLDRGTIQLELAVLEAPLTVENFITLARKGFFDGLTVHRVVPNFVIQAGDPRGDSEGGPGYTIRDELNQRPYLRGTLGMALDWADTGGSQFFITHSPQPHLDGAYTAFGHVVSGMDIVDRIEQGDVIRRVRILDGS